MPFSVSDKEPASQTSGDRTAFSIDLDGKSNSLSAVSRTCHALAELATFDIRQSSDGFSVTVFPTTNVANDAIVRRFRTTLIDFNIRQDIEARTAGMRDLIWKTAFAEAQGRAK